MVATHMRLWQYYDRGVGGHYRFLSDSLRIDKSTKENELTGTKGFSGL